MSGKAKDDPEEMRLGPYLVQTGKEATTRMALLLWGAATCGKTTFAATAPGKKIWLSFGDNEHVSVSHRDDVVLVDLSKLDYSELFKHAQNDNPFGLSQFLAKYEDIETVVVDSLTAIEYKALQKAVGEKVGAGRGFTPTMEQPGISAYGGRNAIVLEVVTGLLRVTADYGVHIIFTAHEADPTMVDNGKNDIIDFIGIQLGGKLVNNTTWRLSEIWYMSQEALGTRERRIMVRPSRKRRPVKSRMFSQKGEAEFVLAYDADLPDDAKGQMTIADWYGRWRDGGMAKIPVPARAEKPAK